MSYEQRPVAEEIDLALTARGYEVFFERSDLKLGEEYDLKIEESVKSSDLFIFLISPASLEADRYTRTELRAAREKWRNPPGTSSP